MRAPARAGAAGAAWSRHCRPGAPAAWRGRATQPDDDLPPLLVRVRAEGGLAVASELPRPYLALDAQRRAELEADERALAERGDALLRDGVDTEL